MKRILALALTLLLLLSSAPAQSLTLPAGVYPVGEAFPMGRWIVTAFNPEVSADLVWAAALGTDGMPDLTQEYMPVVLTELIDAETAEIFEPLQGYLCIEAGDVVFTPADEETALVLEAFLASEPAIPLLAYVGNMNTGKFHALECSSITQMKAKNKAALYAREEAIDGGYVPCKNCNP